MVLEATGARGVMARVDTKPVVHASSRSSLGAAAVTPMRKAVTAGSSLAPQATPGATPASSTLTTKLSPKTPFITAFLESFSAAAATTAPEPTEAPLFASKNPFAVKRRKLDQSDDVVLVEDSASSQ